MPTPSVDQGELSFYGDTLLEGGVMDSLNNGTLYREVRQYSTLTHCLRFYFVTRCYNDYVESIMDDFTNGSAPNVVIMNSCLWDVTRLGVSISHCAEFVFTFHCAV